MKKQIKSQGGFSLIELMVVVGIIGILASIAVPQFSKFQAKARQSEAKTSLAAMYTAEKAFFTEYSFYFTSIRLVGFTPEGSQQRYNVGFVAAVAPPATYTGPALAADLAIINTSVAGACSVNGVAANCTFVGTGNPVAAAATFVAPGATFVAGAIGNPNAAAAATADQWTITNNKVLANAVNGIN